MKAKTILSGLIVLLSTLSAASFSLAGEVDTTFFPVDRSLTVTSSNDRPDPDAHWLEMALVPGEISLQDTHDYQINKGKYVKYDEANNVFIQAEAFVDPDANWLAIALKPSGEINLEDTFNYQLNRDSYVHRNEHTIAEQGGMNNKTCPAC